MSFQWISIHAGPHTWLNKINQRLWVFGVSWSPSFVLGLPPRGGFENSPSDHEPWSIRCHVGIHVDLTSILHSNTPLVPQVLCEANLDRLRLFPPMRVFEVQWSRALGLVCEVALSIIFSVDLPPTLYSYQTNTKSLQATCLSLDPQDHRSLHNTVLNLSLPHLTPKTQEMASS